MIFVQPFGKEMEAPVLEVGSYNVNGSVRIFCPEPYTGVDIEDGPGVDLVISPTDPLPFEDNHFETVISTEMLEHALLPTHCFAEMVRVLAPGGLLLVTARGVVRKSVFPFHNPPDRWRFMQGTLSDLAAFYGLVEIDEREDMQVPGYFLAARKPGDS
jgi:SAM-dependent methyltransferase